MSNVFRRIIEREMPAEIVHEDDWSMAFHDTNPQAPVHILVIPKKDIAKMSDVTEDDRELVGHLFHVANKVAAGQGLQDYRLVINNGSGAGQAVFHLHLHVLGGRPFRWPPG